MRDHPNIQHAFNKAANSYDNHSFVQQSIGKHLIALTKQFSPAAVSTIIDLGCGTGITTQQLVSAFDFHECHATDIAANLLAKAKECLNSKRIHIYEANFDDTSFIKQTFDIIFSNMALHWSINMELALHSFTRLISSNGILAFSIPLTGTFDELPHGARNLFFTIADIEKKLEQSGFTLLIKQHEKIVMPFQDTLTGLQLIKKTGANYVREKQTLGLRGKSFLSQIKLQQLTYCIGYFIAKSPY